MVLTVAGNELESLFIGRWEFPPVIDGQMWEVPHMIHVYSRYGWGIFIRHIVDT